MKHKYLLLILLLPLTLAATSKMLDGNKKENSISGQSPITSDEYCTLSYDEKLSEMMATITNKEVLKKEYKSELLINCENERVKAPVRKFIKRKVLNKLKDKNICSIDMGWKLFSRCPSGYRVALILKDDKLTNEGWMSLSYGCDQNPITRFRYDIDNSKVEARISEKAGYVPLDEFFALYMEAKDRLSKTS